MARECIAANILIVFFFRFEIEVGIFPLPWLSTTSFSFGVPRFMVFLISSDIYTMAATTVTAGSGVLISSIRPSVPPSQGNGRDRQDNGHLAIDSGILSSFLPSAQRIHSAKIGQKVTYPRRPATTTSNYFTRACPSPSKFGHEQEYI